jgi:hypothetical protein
VSEQAQFNPPRIVGPDGQPARRLPHGDNCPRCGADKSNREKAGGFGDPPVICGLCGHQYPGGTEC